MSVTPATVPASKRGAARRRDPLVDTLDITVLSGGPGGEREVSLQSGRAVAQALGRLGHRVTVCDIAPDELSALGRPADFVFIALHGEFGEDGTVQAELDARDIRYSGSGAAASRMAMDKVEAKRAFLRSHIPTPEFLVVDRVNRAELAAKCYVPAVVKPVSSGSSVDITIARTPQQLQSAVEAVVNQYGRALVERYVAGREVTVGILGDRPLPVCEIRTEREFYDYQAKYVDEDTEYLFDLDLPPDVIREVQDLSLAAHQALGCEVFSRVDWMIDQQTLRPYVLEVNTIPGFTDHSLVPKAAARVGIAFDDLCRRIIELSWNVTRVS